MKKLIGIMLLAGVSALAGTVGLPVEKIDLTQVEEGNYLVCVWDAAAETWAQDHVVYDNSGSFEFQIPAWGTLTDGRWYWVGLWDRTSRRYVFGKWIGHVKTYPNL